MKTREITKEQVTYLHEFCKKKDIHYVDLRIELVDHLCELIQAEWEQNPSLSFRDAFHNVYKGFGIFGFMGIAEQHEKTMQKRYWREIWTFFKSWLTPPKVLLTAMLLLGVYFLCDAFAFIRLPLVWTTFSIILISGILSIAQFRRNRHILNEKNMLMGGVHTNFFWVYYIFYLVLLEPIWLRNSHENLEQPWLLAGTFVFIALFSRANYLLLEKARDQLEGLKLKLA
jgi:hypothetical protein